MIVIKKLIISLLTVVLIASAITPAMAATKEELTEQISACQQIKDKAHQMAECARFLGFDEDHIVIQTAKAKWMEAYTEELNLQQQIEEMESAVYVPPTTWTGSVLTRQGGVNYGPNGKETYYNLPMQGVVNIMRRMGYDAERYPYWIREDGVRMLGPYVMISTNFSHWPRGSIVETSLGIGLSCDTGHLGWSHIDIAVSWG